MSKGKKFTKRPKVTMVRHLFHGVSIQPGKNYACAAVKAIAGEKFLSDEVQTLPLESCDNIQACECVYKHFDDRRTATRRDSDIGLPTKDHSPDHRSGTGRRVTDE